MAMRVITLMENTAAEKTFAAEHGLSLYIETKGRKILFDTGPSPSFLANAEKLGADIAGVDYLIISHGHNDHGGALAAFLEVNKKAQVFVQREAFKPHYSLKNGCLHNIGLEESLLSRQQVKLVSSDREIADGIRVFSRVKTRVPRPRSNFGLKCGTENSLQDDLFEHEQNLIITEGDKRVLFTGCAHNGIVNIIEQFKENTGAAPSHVFGGFHLSSRSGRGETPETIERMADYLLASGAICYTGHCTGAKAYRLLREKMGAAVFYLAAGTVFEI